MQAFSNRVNAGFPGYLAQSLRNIPTLPTLMESPTTGKFGNFMDLSRDDNLVRNNQQRWASEFAAADGQQARPWDGITRGTPAEEYVKAARGGLDAIRGDNWDFQVAQMLPDAITQEVGGNLIGKATKFIGTKLFGLTAKEISAANAVGYTGAGTTKLDAAAEAAYNQIRAMYMTDVETVASNIGLSVRETTTLKKQLFFGRHEYPLDRTTLVRQRFAADHEIAFAWNSAATGELSSAQQSWLQQLARHELTERSFMAKGIPYLQQDAWNGARFTGFPKGAHDMAPPPPKINFPGYETPWHLLD